VGGKTDIVGENEKRVLKVTGNLKDALCSAGAAAVFSDAAREAKRTSF
jgi:hypothetical protein